MNDLIDYNYKGYTYGMYTGRCVRCDEVIERSYKRTLYCKKCWVESVESNMKDSNTFSFLVISEDVKGNTLTWIRNTFEEAYSMYQRLLDDDEAVNRDIYLTKIYDKKFKFE